MNSITNTTDPQLPDTEPTKTYILGIDLFGKLMSVRFINGASRFVILIGKFAIKLPLVSTSSAYGAWSGFIGGMQANIQETVFSSAYRHIAPIAPVLLSGPLGLFVVMPRCADLNYVLSAAEMNYIVANEEYNLPVERKQDSFGTLRGQVVALDYG